MNGRWVRQGSEDERDTNVSRSIVSGEIRLATTTSAKMLIPKVDQLVPMTKRHSLLISQYTKAIEEEKASSSTKTGSTALSSANAS